LTKAKVLNMLEKVEELIREIREELVLESLPEEEIPEEELRELEELYEKVKKGEEETISADEALKEL